MILFANNILDKCAEFTGVDNATLTDLLDNDLIVMKMDCDWISGLVQRINFSLICKTAKFNILSSNDLTFSVTAGCFSVIINESLSWKAHLLLKLNKTYFCHIDIIPCYE